MPCTANGLNIGVVEAALNTDNCRGGAVEVLLLAVVVLAVVANPPPPPPCDTCMMVEVSSSEQVRV